MGIRAAVIDFDGTICPQDVSEELLARFGRPEWWDIDLAFQRGEIGSRECLIRQGELLDGGREEMLAFALDRFAVEPTFAAFTRWAEQAGIEVAVASDGFGFYVGPMLEAVGVAGVRLMVNEPSFDAGSPRLAFPFGHPACVGCGTCKMLAVLGYRDAAGPVAFVGEGHTDRYGALYADLVFAKKHLVDICDRDGVPYLPWETFDDVRDGIERTERLPGPVSPAACPGWTLPRRAAPPTGGPGVGGGGTGI